MERLYVGAVVQVQGEHGPGDWDAGIVTAPVDDLGRWEVELFGSHVDVERRFALVYERSFPVGWRWAKHRDEGLMLYDE